MTGGPSRAIWRRPAVWAAGALLAPIMAMAGFAFASAVLPGSDQLPGVVEGMKER